MAARWHSDEVIEVLACNLDQRPAVPGPDALAPFIERARLTQEELIIDLAAEGRAVAEAFVEAERICCSTIAWELHHSPHLQLRIRAEPRQLRVLVRLIPGTVHIEEVQ
jgi:hypothetical protein